MLSNTMYFGISPRSTGAEDILMGMWRDGKNLKGVRGVRKISQGKVGMEKI